MSQTVSRGHHTARRYRTSAITAREHLGKKITTSVPLGALIVLEQLFVRVLEGLGREPRQSPLMAGLCALSIAHGVVKDMQGKEIHLTSLEKVVKNHLALVRKLKENKEVSPKQVRELRNFLTVLVHHGSS